MEEVCEKAGVKEVRAAGVVVAVMDDGCVAELVFRDNNLIIWPDSVCLT